MEDLTRTRPDRVHLEPDVRHLLAEFRGERVRHGDPRDVYGAPGSADVATFVGEANRVPGVVRGEVLETELGSFAWGGRTDAVAVIRPEAIELVADADGPGVVVSVEYYGHDQAVDVRLPSGLQVRARLGTQVAFAAGGRVRVTAARDLLE